MFRAFLILVFFMIVTGLARAQFYYGTGEAVNLENNIGFDKHEQKIITGSSNDPSAIATFGATGSIFLGTDGSLRVKQDYGITTNWSFPTDPTITASVADHESRITQNEADIVTLTASANNQDMDIAALVSDVVTLTASADNQDTTLSDHESRISQNESDITSLNAASTSYVLTDGTRDITGDFLVDAALEVTGSVSIGAVSTEAVQANYLFRDTDGVLKQAPLPATSTGTMTSTNDGITVVGGSDALLSDASVTLNPASYTGTGGITAEQFGSFDSKEASRFGYANAEDNTVASWNVTNISTATLTSTSSSINGSYSYQLSNITGSTSEYACTPDITLPEFGRGKFIGFRMAYTYDGETDDMKVWLEDVTNSASISSEMLEAGNKDVLVAGFSQSTTANVRACMQVYTENNGKNLIMDNLEFVVNPLRSIKLTETQLSRYRSKAGYDTNGRIPYFTNTDEEEGNGIYTIPNNSTDGAAVTFLKDAKACFSFSFGSTSPSLDAGISKNCSPSGPTGFISCGSGKLAHDYARGDAVVQMANAAWCGDVKAGDIIRPHTGGNSSNESLWLWTVYAEAETDATVHTAEGAGVTVTVDATPSSLLNIITPSIQTATITASSTAFNNYETGSTSYKTQDIVNSEGQDSFLIINSNQLTLLTGVYNISVPVGAENIGGWLDFAFYSITDSANEQEFLDVVGSTTTEPHFNTVFFQLDISATETFEFRTKSPAATGREYMGTIKIERVK